MSGTACGGPACRSKEIRFGVHVAPSQLPNPKLPTALTSALEKSGIAPGRLELEITEGVFLDETASSEQMFKMLKSLGVRLALEPCGGVGMGPARLDDPERDAEHEHRREGDERRGDDEAAAHLGLEAEADAAHGHEQHRVVRVVAELAPE